MKTKLLPLLLILLMIVLSACSGENATAAVDSTDAATEEGTDSAETTPGTGQSGEMDDSNQLILGTLMLDGTDNAVTQDQAEEMLPLWQLYQAMSTEDTTASEELEAILNQIEGLFTAEQLAAMEELDYSDPTQMMEQLGLELGDSEDGEFTLPEGFTGDFSGEMPEGFEGGERTGGGGEGAGGGDFAGGGGGGGGGGNGGGGEFIGGGVIVGGEGITGDGTGTDFDPEAMATAQAERGGGFANRQSLMFLPALIEYLENIAAT
jgi:hypothetical protein